MDLFSKNGENLLQRLAPLADRMRPRTLDEYIGQQHIIGEGRLLRRAIQIDQLSSLIFYGPPGTGKTTLARIIANTTKAQFISINAVLAGVKEIREAIESAQNVLNLYGRRTILFVDEVHRFNKSQQDALLPHVENGILILIGATTENPYFEVNKALVSRSRIFQLKTLTEDDLKAIAMQAIGDKERGYGNRVISIDDDALDHLVKVANGDARGVLNALELAVETTNPDSQKVISINRKIAEESIQKRAVLYDKDGDVHYDTISAFIKSIRGSDPDAALYWMSKMIYAGEDPRFIFRRMLILACEDVGMADPHALGVVMDAANAFDYVGMPEGRYHLAHACLYLATAAKSNSSLGFFDALKLVEKEATDDVPDHLRDANRDGQGLGHGENYLYPHAYRDHWVAQQYLPASLQGKLFYQPSDQGYEKSIAEKVCRLREAQLEALLEDNDSNALFAQEKNAGKGQWIQRTMGSSGEQLGKIRDKIISLGGFSRADLVLDLNAGSGLLTFEAARCVPDGAVWAVVHDQKSLSTLSKMSERFDPLNRPQLVLSDWNRFDTDLRKSAGQNVRFDKIIGRSVLAARDDKKKIIHTVLNLLGTNGKIILAENVVSEGQRISDLLDSEKTDPVLLEKLIVAESELFSDPSDHLVNWTSSSLEQELKNTDSIKVNFNRVTESVQRIFKVADIDYWFRKTGGSSRLSLGERLEKTCDQKEMETIKKMLHLQLGNRSHTWKSVILYICLQR
ncbi:MAG TPA: AAA family ATPase [Chitinispirillaceae bacterium]|nr:AAA family ATPase [Chitinispirillaceae bacterium]